MLNFKDQIEDNNSENVEESISEDENGIYPLVNLNISLNNGQKKSLIIYENDNVKGKVKEFCFTNRISPNDEEVLLQRVKEELDSKSIISKTGNFNFDNISNNKNIEKPENRPISNNNFLDYVPKEKNRLDQILNESDSISVSQSLNQQSNNLDSLIREYKNDDDVEKENTLEQNNIIEKTSKANNINNDLKKSVSPIINNNDQPKLFSNDNFMNSVKSDNSPNNINKPTIIKSDYNNLNQNINMKVIPNKEINKYNSYYGKKNNQIINNNSGINKTQINNTYKNTNNSNKNNLPLNNSIYSQENINPFTSLINQKVEFLDTYNNSIKNSNNIISSPNTKSKTIIYNTIQNENNVKYKQNENPKNGIIATNNNKVILQNNKEPYNYNYETKIFNSNQSNPNINNFHSNNIYNQINNENKNESIAYNNNQGQYTNLNNINSNHIITDINNPQSANINYDNLISNKDINDDFPTNKNSQSDKYDIVNQTEYSTYENMNLQGFNGNFDKANSQILKYNINEILTSPTLENDINSQKVKYKDGPNIFSNQNSQYQIYENIQSPKSLKNNNYINGLNNQKEEKSDKLQKVKVLKLENFDYNLNKKKTKKLTDVDHINKTKVQNMNYSNKNVNTNINEIQNLINAIKYL